MSEPNVTITIPFEHVGKLSSFAILVLEPIIAFGASMGFAIPPPEGTDEFVSLIAQIRKNAGIETLPECDDL